MSPVKEVATQARTSAPRLATLLTRKRWIEIARIVGVGVVVLFYSQGIASLPLLLAAVGVGLCPLVKTGDRRALTASRPGATIPGGVFMRQ